MIGRAWVEAHDRARNWRRYAVGVNPVSSRNTTDSWRWSENPACRATSDIDMSVSASRDLPRSRWTRRISSQTPRPRASRTRRSRVRRETGTSSSTSLTWIGSWACWRMKRSAAATSASSMARTSVETRVTTPCGGRSKADPPRRPRARGRGQEAVEQPGRLEADPLGRQRHARQRGPRQLAQQVVVIHADQGDLLGHPQARVPADLGKFHPLRVVAGQDTDRPGQADEPSAQPVVPFPEAGRVAFRGIGLVIGGDPIARRLERRPEACLPAERERMIRVADEAEMAEAPIEQVFRRKATDRDVVHPDTGDRQVGEHAGDVDDRHPRLDQGVGQLAVEDVGDHPVVAERAHRAHRPRLGRDRREDPVRTGLGECLDPPQDIAVEVQAVAHHQADADRVLHRATSIPSDAIPKKICAIRCSDGFGFGRACMLNPQVSVSSLLHDVHTP